VLRARLWIFGTAVAFVVTMLLPWFREVLPDGSVRTVNAFGAGMGWAIPIVLAVAAFVGLALYASERDVRFFPYAGVAAAVAAVLVLARCWVNLGVSVAGSDVERRWGLFIALNAAPLFGLALRSAGTAVMRQMMPPATERDYGYGI
jgi:hypothetical protein